MTPEELERYARHIVLREIGGPGQRRLGAARALVVGAGGLGCPALAYLAAAGVGRITLVDDDTVSLSNLQRQTLFGTDDVGTSKVAVAATRAQAINPHVEVTALLERIEPDSIGMIAGHDVVVDGTRGKVFASATGEDHLSVFDARTFKELPAVTLESGVDDGTLTPMSLVLDEKGGKLFTVSIGTPEAAVIDVASGKVEKVIDLGNSISASGVAFDAARNRLYVASQGTDNLLIVDVAAGRVLHDVPVGAGALNVAFDDASGLAYVSNRGAGTVTVVNGDGKVVANLDGGTLPNHVRADGKGNVFAVNKSRGAEDPKGDRITRITPKQ